MHCKATALPHTLSVPRIGKVRTTLEATLGQMDGFSSQLPCKFHLKEVASVGD